MEADLFLLNVIILTLAVVALPFGVFAAIFSFRQFRRAHENLQVLNGLATTFYVFLPVATIWQYSMLFCKVDPNSDLFVFCLFVVSTIPSFITWFGIGVCIERTLATVYSNSYENGRIYKYFLPLIILFVVGIVFFKTVFTIYIIVGTSAKVVTYIQSLVSNLIHLVFVVKLSRLNLRNRITQEFQLSGQFQTVENIKMLKLMRPQAVIDVGAGFTAIVVGLLAREVGRNEYGIILFYIVYNIYVIVTFCYWTLQNFSDTDWGRKLMCRDSRVYPQVGDADENNVWITTALGDVLEGQATMEDHFIILAKFWT